MCFSPCNNYLLSGSRNSADVLCWDLRTLKQSAYAENSFANYVVGDGNTRVQRETKNVCARYLRSVDTNQRVQFGLCGMGRYLVSGQTNGDYCAVFDVLTEKERVAPSYKLHHQPQMAAAERVRCVGAAQLCPTYPFLATTVGERVLQPRKRGNTAEKTEQKKKNDETAAECSSSDESSDDCAESAEVLSNVNDICIWDLRPPQST